MRLLKIYLFALLISSNQILVAQEDATEGEAPSTVQQLLELVKEGQVREPVSYTHLTLPTILSV